MTAKEYLKQYQTLDERIFEKSAKLKRLQERRGYSSASANIERSSLPSDKVAKLAADITDTETEIARLKSLKTEIESRVDSLRDHEHREILQLHFLQGIPAVMLGRRLYCSRESVYKRIREALAYFAGCFGENLYKK